MLKLSNTVTDRTTRPIPPSIHIDAKSPTELVVGTGRRFDADLVTIPPSFAASILIATSQSSQRTPKHCYCSLIARSKRIK